MIDKWQLYSQTGVDGPEYGVRIRPGYTVVGFQKEDAQAIVAWQNASIQPEGDILERVKAADLDLLAIIDWGKLRDLFGELIAEVEKWKSAALDETKRRKTVAAELGATQNEVKRLRSENDRAERAHESLDCMRRHEIASLNARIKEREELITEVERLRSEIEIDNKLLADRDRIYEVCQCPDHGKCTPYVIEQLKSIPEKDARIKELEAGKLMYEEIAESYQIGVDDLRAYIKRMEEAFLEANRCPTCNGAGKLIDVVISRKLGRVESERVCPLCEGKWEEKAREALEQIRSSNHIVEANLVLTAEQREAVQYLIELATDGKYPPYPGGVLAEKIEILRSLLDGKAGGKDEFTNG